MDVAEYRFLPWTRRGLAAQLLSGDELPARPDVSVGLTLTGDVETTVGMTVYGPGDVLGIDTRLVVRTDPVAFASDVEPNYMPAVDFDLPDLPWMFTPAGAPASQRLAPWLVLVCVDAAVVAAPALEPGTPLPRITVAGPDVADELPDLRDSWAWAHTQVLRDDEAGPVTGAELAAEPTLNVSRLVCPRRLEPDHTYHACLVPAFDVGVSRGLTGRAAEATVAGPAWDVDDPATTSLPVYFHWTFSTGPVGDFEQLARRLRPFECPPTVGSATMHVGSADPALPVVDFDDGGRLDMDGALRAPVRDSGTIDDVADDLVDALAARLDAADEHAAGQAGDTDPVGPPIYAGWHLDRHRIGALRDGVLAELNLDPRRRAAAAIGAAVVRRNQEEFVQEAWEQVGEVLRANRAMARSRLFEEVLARLHRRVIAPLADDELFLLVTPLLDRMVTQQATVRSRITPTSMPDQLVDGALRRLAAPRQRLVRAAARTRGVELAAGPATTMVAALAAGTTAVDPTSSHLPEGITHIDGLDEVTVPTGTGSVDLAPLGIDVQVAAGLVRDALGSGTALADTTVRPRDDLATVGVVTGGHLASLAEVGDARQLDGTASLVDRLREAAVAQPDALAFQLVPGAGGKLLGLSVRGRELVRIDDGAATVVGRIDDDLGNRLDDRQLGQVLATLPPGTLAGDVPASEVPTIGLDDDRIVARLRDRTTPLGGVLRRGEVSLPERLPLERLPVDRLPTERPTGRPPIGRPPVERPPIERPPVERPPVEPGPRPPAPPTTTVPAPDRTPEVVTAMTTALEEAIRVGTDVAVADDATATVVPFPLASAAATVRAGTDPHGIVGPRLASRIRLGDQRLLDPATAGIGDHLRVASTRDRIWAAPSLPEPLYARLAAWDPDRFVPGVEVIPPNAITLLETNPEFVAAFLAGVNHEFNAELLWRGYPTDRRGTSFRHFWDWVDGGADIAGIHGWRGSLGGQARGAGDGNLVLLVRGDLLRRYPNAVVYAWRAGEAGPVPDPAPGDLRDPVFAGRFDPDFTFAGFDLRDDDLVDPGWYFVIAEQPTEPRFGMDEPVDGGGTPALPSTWADLRWDHAAVDPGRHLRIAGNRLEGHDPDGLAFVDDAAHLAAITLQKPFRVAVHHRHLVVE